MRIRIIPLLFFFIFLSHAAFSQPAVKINFPIPQDAKIMDSKGHSVLGDKKEVTMYSTGLSEQEILKFYKEQMPKYGWQEKESRFSKDTKSPIKTARFFKGDYNLFLFIPPAQRHSGQRLFSLNYGKNINSEEACKEEAKKIGFMPIYPGAELIYFSNGETYIFSLKQDPLEKIVSFYEDKMPGFGWLLSERAAINELAMDKSKMPKDVKQAMKEIDKIKIPPKPVVPACKDCKPQASELTGLEDAKSQFKGALNEAKVFKAKLAFRKTNEDRIVLNFEQVHPFDRSTIQVKYYEKK